MNWWQYLLLVNIYLVLFFGFYVLLLKRETFFQLNRLYLVSAALLSFLIPVIHAGWVQDLFITQQVHASLYSTPVLVYQFKQPVANTAISIGTVLAVLYIVGVALLIVRLGWQLISLKKILKGDDEQAPYAFFRKVKLDSAIDGNDIIAVHEQVHANQLHSADVLIIEAVMIVNWFNPVVYFYRYAIKHIHEFIADSYTLKQGTDKTDYAMLLLKQTFNAPQHQLVSNFFNRGLLKQRIIMLQKNRSARIKLIKYGLSAPLFGLMLVLSAATVNTSKAVERVTSIAGNVFELPADRTAFSKLRSIKLLPPAPVDNITNTSKLKNEAAAIKKEIDSVRKANLKGKVTNLQIMLDTVPKDNSQVFTAVEQEPAFPGGNEAFMQYLSANIRYPAIDKTNKVQGRVIVEFVVEKNGSLSSFKVLRAPSQTLADEAVRVLSQSPNWKPGIQNGRLVRVEYTVPIAFTLADVNTTEPAKMLNNLQVVGYKGLDSTKKLSRSTFSTGAKTGSLTTDTTQKTFKVIYDPYENTKDKPLLIVDGKIRPYDDMQSISPDKIESIRVYKGKSAIDLYGAKALNGAIDVTLKK